MPKKLDIQLMSRLEVQPFADEYAIFLTTYEIVPKPEVTEVNLLRCERVSPSFYSKEFATSQIPWIAKKIGVRKPSEGAIQ